MRSEVNLLFVGLVLFNVLLITYLHTAAPNPPKELIDRGMTKDDYLKSRRIGTNFI